MAVVVEAITVIVRRDAVRTAYAEEPDRFLRRVPNATLRYDDRLAGVGFMNDADVRAFVHLLEADGLRQPRGGEAPEFALVDRPKGALDPVPWLEVDAMEVHGGTVRGCWAAGARGSSVAIRTTTWRSTRSRRRVPEHSRAAELDRGLRFALSVAGTTAVGEPDPRSAPSLPSPGDLPSAVRYREAVQVRRCPQDATA